MKTFEDLRKILLEHKQELRERFKVKKIGLFGSFVRGEQTEGSDVDVVVEFEEGYKTFDNYMDLKFYLESLFSANVDLLIESAIKARLKPYIFDEVRYA